MSIRVENPLKSIMEARSVVFYGASNNPQTMGTVQFLHLVHGGYTGKYWPIHPKEDKVLGVPALRSVNEIPEVPDLAVMVLPTKVVPAMMLECAKKGVKRVVIISGGFKERGPEGEKLQNEVMAIAREHGMRIIGPNCIGVINASQNLNVTFFPYTLGPGPMGLISMSGTYVTQALFYLERRGIRFSKAMSLGNEADIDIVDGLEYLGDDPDTKAIGMYIESIRRGRDFIEVAKRVSMKKPIVAYYVGGSEGGARSCASHTASMGGSDAVHDGMFKQCGIIRAPTLDLMYDWAWALATQPLPKGRRVAIVSNSGGPVTSMADAASRVGLELPILSDATREKLKPHVPPTGSTQNPVDMTYNMTPDSMTNKIPNIVFDSGEVDAVLVHGIMMSGFIRSIQKEAPTLPMGNIDPASFRLFADAFHKELVALSKVKGCPVLTTSFGDRSDEAIDYIMKHDIPCYPTPERAVFALKAMALYSEWLKSRTG